MVGGKLVIGFQFVEVLALGVEPVDVLEEDAQVFARHFWWVLVCLCTSEEEGLD